MTNWMASTKTPASKPADLELDYKGPRKTKGITAQVEAATEMAKKGMAGIDGPVEVVASGYEGDEDRKQITVTVLE